MNPLAQWMAGGVCLLAQASTAVSPEWPLGALIGQFGLGGVVAWMLFTQSKEREAERLRAEARERAIADLSRKIDCMARAQLLHLMQAAPTVAQTDEVRDIIRHLRDQQAG